MTTRTVLEFGTAREQWETPRNVVDRKKKTLKSTWKFKEKARHISKKMFCNGKFLKRTRKYVEKY